MAKHLRVEVQILSDLNSGYIFPQRLNTLYYIGWSQVWHFPVNIIFLFDQLWENMIEEHRAIYKSFFLFSQVALSSINVNQALPELWPLKLYLRSQDFPNKVHVYSIFYLNQYSLCMSRERKRERPTANKENPNDLAQQSGIMSQAFPSVQVTLWYLARHL